MKEKNRGRKRKGEVVDDAEFHRLFVALSPESQLVVRNLMLVWRLGRRFKLIDPIIIGSHTNKKERNQ